MALARWEAQFARVSLALAGVGITVAAALQPDPAGVRAGSILLRPSCALRAMSGLPCPSCGMTRAWVWTVHGDPLGAAAYNAGGVLLLAGILLNGAAGAWTLARGAPPRWGWPALKAWGVLFAVVWLGGWFLRLGGLYPLPP